MDAPPGRARNAAGSSVWNDALQAEPVWENGQYAVSPLVKLA
jgi:hypothetical protein